MINVGDIVKVISDTEFNGDRVTFYAIGTICKVVDKDYDGALGIVPDKTIGMFPYYYLENELEKGHFEWIKE